MGIATGASGVLVLDVDERHGGRLERTPTGWRLYSEGRLVGELPRSRVHRSGGGWHVFLQHVAGVAKITGVDIKSTGDGDGVVAPPSRHKDGGAYTVLDDSPIAKAPAWLTTATTTTNTKITTTKTDETLDALLEAALLARGGRRAGDEIHYRCTDHDDSTPSASYNTRKNVWHCKACDPRGKDATRKALLQRLERLGLWTAPTVPKLAAVERLRALVEAQHWGRHGTDRAVMLAHLAIAEKAQRLEGYTVARATIAEAVNVGEDTVSNAHRRLRLAGWLEMHPCQCAKCRRLPPGVLPKRKRGGQWLPTSGTIPWHSKEASSWTLHVPRALLRSPTTPVLSPLQGVVVGTRNTLSHDAFAHRALGKGAAASILAALDTGGPYRTAAELGRAAGVPVRSSVTRALARLVPCGAAVETSAGWIRGPATLDAIAEHYNTAGRNAARREWHRHQREAYGRALDRRDRDVARDERGDHGRLALVPMADADSGVRYAARLKKKQRNLRPKAEPVARQAGGEPKASAVVTSTALNLEQDVRSGVTMLGVQ